MHSNNQYYLRAITAEKELDLAMTKGRALYADNQRLARDHVYALKVIEGLGSTLQSRRHRLATWAGRRLGAPEMNPVDLAAMLKGIRAALDALPLPAVGQEPTPPTSESAADPAPQSEPLRVIGGRDG